MENANFCLIIVCAIFLFCGLSGLVKGLVRKASGIIALILSGVLVSVLLPHVTETLRNETPVESLIMDKCQEIGEKLIVSFLSRSGEVSINLSGEDDASLQELSENIQNTDLASALRIPRADQMRLIDALPVPESMKDKIKELNNDEGFEKFNAGNFSEFLTGYFASLIFNAICFLITLALVFIVTRIIFLVAGFLTSLPVVGTVNRLGGLLAGLLQGLVIVWILFLILTLLAGSETGAMLMRQIYEDPFLKGLYDHNFFLSVVDLTLDDSASVSAAAAAFLPDR